MERVGGSVGEGTALQWGVTVGVRLGQSWGGVGDGGSATNVVA